MLFILCTVIPFSAICNEKYYSYCCEFRPYIF